MRRNREGTVVAACLAASLVLSVCSPRSQDASKATAEKRVILKGSAPSKGGDPLTFVHLEEEGFPLNVNPEIVAASDASIDDGDMVMGVVIEREARAYPVNYMNGPRNEIVNDRLGGRAITPSW